MKKIFTLLALLSLTFCAFAQNSLERPMEPVPEMTVQNLSKKEIKALMASDQTNLRCKGAWALMSQKPSAARKTVLDALKSGNREYAAAVLGYADEVVKPASLVSALTKDFPTLDDAAKACVLYWAGRNGLTAFQPLVASSLQPGEAGEAAVFAATQFGGAQNEALLKNLIDSGSPLAAIASALKGAATDDDDDTRSALRDSRPDEGWISLFDGETMAGWRDFNGTSLGNSSWVVEDGAIMATGKGDDANGYLVTERVFENFDLKWEWKISKGGNSGMIYHVVEGPAYKVPYVTGPEYQLIDDENYAEMNDGYVLQPWQRCAVDYAMYVPDFETRDLKPAGEWNESEIIFDNGHVTYLLNGKVTVEFDAWTPDWFARKNSGKWNNAPEYGLSRRGVICLQDHGYPAWFRNLRVKELPNIEVEEDLFNGKDLSGWVNYGTEKWYVDSDGCLVCESGPDKGYGYFATEKYYNDFDLTLEFKQEANGNSGVFIRSTVDGTRVSGWQVEVAPKGNDTGGIYESYGRGWLVQIPDEKESILKEGEWNTMRILCVGDRVQTWLNGQPMVDLTDNSIGAGNGRIALQIHDGGGIKVRWRNLHIKTL